MWDNPRQYLSETRRMRALYPGRLRTSDLLRWYRPWVQSRNPGRQTLTDASPWLTFAAIELIGSVLTPHSRAFEWGSGGSTLFLAQRCAEVVSVEHDQDWYERVKKEVAAREIDNWQGHIETSQASNNDKANPSDWEGYASGSDDFRGRHFRRYVETIDAYPDAYFDLILIDGRARPSCFKHALAKVRVNGHIVWDNSDRTYYHRAMEQASNRFQRRDMPGPVPYIDYFTCTTAWQRLD